MDNNQIAIEITYSSDYENDLDISDEVVDELIDRFYEGIAYMYWNEWFNMNPVEKESHVVDPILESGDFDDIDENKIYEIFWDWVKGLDEDDFCTEEDDYLDYFNSI